MSTDPKVITRILEDVEDGVMVLDGKGVVLFVNQSCKALLGIESDSIGRKYAAVMMGDETGQNDAFHQFLIDAVYDKEHTHTGEIVYTQPGGHPVNLRVNTTFLHAEDGVSRYGVVIQFTDMTALVAAQRMHKEASVVFIATMVCVCEWVFLYMLWDFLGRPIPSHLMTQLVQINGVIMFLFVKKNTSFKLREMGLGVKNLLKNVKTDALIGVTALAVMAILKLVIMRFVPGFFDETRPFWDWSAMGISEWYYPLTVVLQEFLTRGVMHENLRRIIPGKNREWLSIVVSSIAFGVLHIHMGLVYMIGAAILLGALGMLYRRQNSIWGLCVPHYMLGMALVFMGWV